MRDIVVTVPTIRRPEVVLDYVRNGISHGFNVDRLYFLVISEDSVDHSVTTRSFKDAGLDFEIFGQAARDQWFRDRRLQEFGDLIPKRSHAETSFGLLVQREDSQLRTGVFIDDDTIPLEAVDFFGTHVKGMRSGGDYLEVSSDKGWVNTLFQSFERHHTYPRGYPFGQMDERTVRRTVGVEPGQVAVIQGLWTGVPDLDSIRILHQGGLRGIPKTTTEATDFPYSFVIAEGVFTTVCSMNLSFDREIIPAFYQLPMDDNPWHVGRFDDIWSGLIVKRVLDVKRKKLLCGHPLVRHNKFPRSTFKDLMAESPALELNEHLYSDLGELPLHPDTYENLAERIAVSFKESPRGDFVRYTGRALERWVDLVRRVG